MPGFDGTGPRGQGSRTGRGMGNCNTSNDTVNNNNTQRPIGGAFRCGRGRGFGRGLSRGLGFRAQSFNKNKGNE